MKEFILKEILQSDIKEELDGIGFDKSYQCCAAEKFLYKNIKIFSLKPAQANILKQTALSFGADCATHRQTIVGDIEFTDCILGGSQAQLKKIADKLAFQPFSLKFMGEEIQKFIDLKHTSKPQIVGILNITPDSFSDGGEFLECGKAIEHLQTMIEEGADIIDIGAESTKPFSQPVPDNEQLKRILPVLDYVKKSGLRTTISIDTRSSKVAEECIKRGASIINDVSGFDFDSAMPDVAAKHNVKIILQHSAGTPENMQKNPHYENLMDEIYLSLRSKRELALSRGIKQENIILDPGIGFGKTRENNFEIIRRVEEFYGLGCPIMLGISRKSLLNIPEADNFTKDIYTTALNTLAVERKVDFLRVHNVKLHKTLLEIMG